MSRSTKRVAVIAALALLAGLALVSNGSPAASQAPAAPDAPTWEAITLPEGYAPTAAEAGQSLVNRAYVPSAEVATTPESNDGEAGDPLEAFSESVIGADGRVQVNTTTTYPSRAIGQIEGTDNITGSYICTGWLIDADSILTAGHCLYPSANNPTTTLEFFPGRNGASDPYGSCDIDSGFAPQEWIVNQNEYNDFAIVNLDCTVGTTVGWFGIFSVGGQTALRHVPVRVQGYPGDKPFGTMWGMGDRVETSQKKMVFYDLDTAGGQSGSPAYQPQRAACGGPCGMAIHAYGVHGSGPHGLYNHAPRITNPRFGLICDVAELPCA